MNDHEKHVAISSRVRNSSCSSSSTSSPLSSDRFGVSWGEELLDDSEPRKKQKNIKYYASFYLDGTKYRQNDTVYLLSAEGPPHIGRIQTLYEKVKDKEKQMFVRWFCRPSELPEGLPDVDYSKNCKEVFMTWGVGAKNVNHPASIIRHCSVLCTGGEEAWNTNFPSIEEIAAADHIFDRVYDLNSGTLRSLDGIVSQYGKRYVTGKGVGPPRTKRSSILGKKTAAGRFLLDRRPLPLAMRASPDLPSLSFDCSGLPALVPSPGSPHVPSFPVEGGAKESLPRKSSPSTMKVASEKSKAASFAHQKVAEEKMIPKAAAAAAHQGSKRARVNLLGNDDTPDSQRKRLKVESSNGSLLPQQAQERFAGRKIPSPLVGEGRKKPSNGAETADASLPQQTQERRAGGSKPPSPGAEEGRKKSSNGLTTADASLLQQAQERLAAGSKLPSARNGDGRKKSSNDLTFADASFPQQAHKRVAAGCKLPSSGAGEAGRKPSNEQTIVDPQVGPAVLNRERQKGKLKVSCNQNSFETMKRLRADASDQKGSEEGDVKKCKLSSPSHIVHVAPEKEVTKVKDNVSPSGAIDPKMMGQLRSPRVVDEKQLSENGSSGRQQQPQVREVHKSSTNQKQDGSRVSSSLSERWNEVKASLRNKSLDVDNKIDVRSLSPDQMPDGIHGARKQSTKEANGDGIVHTVDAKDAVCLVSTTVNRNSPPLKQNSANLKSIDLEQDTKPFINKRSADGLEKRIQSNTQEDVEGKSALLTKIRKVSTSNETLPPTPKDNRLVNKWNPSVKIEGSQTKPSSARDSSLPSKRPGASLVEDSRHGGTDLPPQKVLKKTLSEVGASTLKKNIMRKSDTLLVQRRTEQSGEEIKVKKIGLQAESVLRVSTKKLSNETRTGISPQGLVHKVAKTLARKLQPESAAKLGVRVPAPHTTVAPSDDHPEGKFEPWEESLRIALEQRKALLLQNIDPWFSSSEIEGMLQELLKTGAIDVRMLPPKSFACYASGKALVLFRTRKLAEQALEKLTENWLIWSKDERPVLASLADAEMSANGRIHGFYSAEMFGARGLLTAGDDQKNAVATSHCSQPNTVEYEMGIQWRLMQDRHEEAWTISAKVQKATSDEVEKVTKGS